MPEPDTAATILDCPGEGNGCRCACHGCKYHCSAHDPTRLWDEPEPTTAARRNVIGAALRSYKSETEQYLLTYKSWPLTNPYDPACCDTCRREHARWETGEVSRKFLVERLDTINDALSEVLTDV